VVVRTPALTRRLAAGVFAVAAHTASAVVVDPEAFVLDARCRDGRPQGAYRLRDADGQLRVAGAFDEGVRTSSFLFWRANGARAAQVPYDDNGRVNGTLATWFDADPGREPTMRFESEVRAGVRQGETRSWYADGRPRTRADYDAGRILTAEAWDERGRSLRGDAARALAARDARDADAEAVQRDALIREHMPRCD
jgi:hypothetical protein